jgi:hypothetical protein
LIVQTATGQIAEPIGLELDDWMTDLREKWRAAERDEQDEHAAIAREYSGTSNALHTRR